MKHKPYSMKAENGIGKITIYDDIGSSWWSEGITASGFQKDLAALGAVETLDVHINSVGGSVIEGAAIYSMLANHPAHVNVHIDGYAMSMASAIAMAGDTILMAEHGLLMVHKPVTRLAGNADELRAEADVLDQFEGSLMKVYVARTGLPEDDITALLRGDDGADGTYMDADTALELGFIDEIVAAKAAPAAALATLDPVVAATFDGMTDKAKQWLAEPPKQGLVDRLLGKKNASDKEVKLAGDLVSLQSAHHDLQARYDALLTEHADFEARLAVVEPTVAAASTEATAAERERIVTILAHADEMGVACDAMIVNGVAADEAFRQMLAAKEAIDAATANVPKISDGDVPVAKAPINTGHIYAARKARRNK